jgi:hypothetical protein
MKEILNLLPVDETKNYLYSVGQSDICPCPTDALPKNKKKQVGRHTDKLRAGARTRTRTHARKRTKTQIEKEKIIKQQIAHRRRVIRDFINGVRLLAPELKTKDHFVQVLGKSLLKQMGKADFKMFYDLVHCFTLINSHSRKELTTDMYLTNYQDYSQAFRLLKWKDEPLKELLPRSYKQILDFIIKEFGDKIFFTRSIEMRCVKYSDKLIARALNYFVEKKVIIRLDKEKYRVKRFNYKPYLYRF